MSGETFWNLFITYTGRPYAVLRNNPHEATNNDEPDYVSFRVPPSDTDTFSRLYDSLEALLEAPELKPEHITKIILTFL